MGFKGDTALLLKTFLFVGFVLGNFAWAAKPTVRAVLTREVGTACRSRAQAFKELDYLSEVPVLAKLPVTAQTEPVLLAKFQSFSSDLLVKLTLFFEQDIGTRCPLNRNLVLVVDLFKKAYLTKLNVPLPLPREEVDTLFRGLVLSGNEAGAIAVKLKSFTSPLSPLQRLGLAYDSYVEKQGSVVIVSPSAELAAKFQTSLAEVCEQTPCAFWDGRLVERVMIVDQTGIASFLPELGVLVISKAILEKADLLHRLVLLHELTHVAERLSYVAKDENWSRAFGAFSGWHQEKPDGKWTVRAHPIHAQWRDVLNQSSDDDFGFKPDEVVVGETGFDGFGMQKTYREGLKRGEISEDIADHVALFRYFPERFCWKGKPLAHGKYRWILAKNFFAQVQKPSCE